MKLSEYLILALLLAFWLLVVLGWMPNGDPGRNLPPLAQPDAHARVDPKAETNSTPTIFTGTITNTLTMNQVYHFNSKETIESAELKDGKLIVTRRRVTPSNMILTSYPPQLVPDFIEIWRDIYASKEGKIVLEKTEKATYTPPKTETTPEKVEWPKP